MLPQFLLLVATAAHAHWVNTCAAEYEAEIRLLRDAHQPVTPADVRPKPIADADNAKADLIAAVKAIRDDTPAFKAIDDSDVWPVPPLTPQQAADLKTIYKGTVPAILQVMLLRPVVDLNAAAALRYFRAVEVAIDAPDAPGHVAAMRPWEDRRAREFPTYRPTRILTNITTPSFRRWAGSRYRILSAREAAATTLAAYWYAAEHDGRLPETLGDLVPKYLPRLPRDYEASNRPLRYRGGEDPILWGVGEDGQDDGGIERDPKNPAHDSPAKTDAVYRLKPRP